MPGVAAGEAVGLELGVGGPAGAQDTTTTAKVNRRARYVKVR